MYAFDHIAGPRGWLSRIPWWVWVPLGWVIILLVVATPVWVSGVTKFPGFDQATLVAPTYFVAPLAAIVYLTKTAEEAFSHFRPALGAGAEDDIAAWQRRITSVHPRAAWLWLVIGGGLMAVGTYLDPSTPTGEMMRTSGLSTVVWGILSPIGFGLNLVLAGLIIRQIRVVTAAHRRATEIDLFRPVPLHSFASLTARAGVVFLFLMMYSALTDPSTFDSRANFAFFAAGVALAGATFLLPLIGMRNRLRREKIRLRDEAAARLSALTAEMHAAIDERRLDEIGDLKTSLEVLTAEQQRIKKVSAWPWETATLRGFLSTLLVPVTIWLVTNLLGETLGF